MSEGFYICRLGSKKNDIKYFKKMLPMDIKTVIEPFGGGFAVSRIVYNDDKYKKVINDLDKGLYRLYTEGPEYIKRMNKLIEKRGELLRDDGKFDHNKLKLEAKKQLGDFYGMWIYQQELSACHIKINKKPYIEPELKNYEFHNEEYLKIMEDHRKDKNAFIFLDPPYLFSDNTSYRPNKEGGDMTDIMVKTKEMMKDKKTKAKIMLVINKLDIVKYFFKDFNIFEYEKIYQVGKKKSIHLVITNYGV